MLPALLLLDPAEFIMVRKQLLGIKWRAERLAASQAKEDVRCVPVLSKRGPCPGTFGQ